MKRILCFGDSNTWGFVPGSDGERFPASIRWTGVLQSELGPEFVVIEEGQNGRTTMWDDPGSTVDKNGMRFLPVVLESQKPLDLVIVMLGTNDLKIHLGLSANAIAHGAGCLVERIQLSDAGPDKKAPQVLLVAPAPVSEGDCPFGRLFDGAPARSRELKKAYQEIATSYGVGFLNAGDYASCPIPDTIHLDAEGCERLGKAMAIKVRELL